MKYGYGGQFPVYFINETIRSNDWKLSNLSMDWQIFLIWIHFRGSWELIHPTRTIQNKLSEFPYLLKDQGYTKSVLFSFNGQDQNPSIIFGGISTNIIDGPLVRAPLLK